MQHREITHERIEGSIELLHLASLIGRASYLERLDRERGGPTPSRAAELNAITWALELLCRDPRIGRLYLTACKRAEQRELRLTR